MAGESVFDLYADLGLNSAPFKKGLADAKAAADGFGSKIGGVFSSLESSYTQGAKQVGLFGSAGVAALGAFAVSAAFSASKIDELTLALHAVGKANGVNATEVDNAVKSIRAQNISYEDSLKVTSNLITANIKLTDGVKLATVAKDLAIGTDLGSSDALSLLTSAIVTNQTQQLQQFGILTTQTQAYEAYAASIGKGSAATKVNAKSTAANVEKLSRLKEQLLVAQQSVSQFTDKTKESTRTAANFKIENIKQAIDELSGSTTVYSKATKASALNLTQEQKQQALLNVVLEAGTKRVGAYDAAQQSASKQFRSLTTRIIPDFIVEIGRAFEPSLAVIVTKITETIKDMGKWLEGNKDKVAQWGKILADNLSKGINLLSAFVNFLVTHKDLVLAVLGAIAIAIFTTFVVSAAPLALFIATTTAGILLLKAAWELLSPQLQQVYKDLGPLLDSFSKLYKDISPLLTVIGTTVAMGLVGAMYLLITAVDLVVKSVTIFTDWVNNNHDQLETLGVLLLPGIALALGAIGVKAGIATASLIIMTGVNVLTSLGAFAAASWLAAGPYIALAAALGTALALLDQLSKKTTGGKGIIDQFKALPEFFSGVAKGKIKLFASGTNFAPGGAAIVGEHGPELVNLPRGSQVVPNNRLGMGDTFNINLTGVMASSRADLRQVGEDIISAIDEARRAKGKATILG